MCIVAALDIDAEALDLEIIRHLPENPAGQKLERSIRALIGIAKPFLLLDLVEETRDAGVIFVKAHPNPLKFREDIRFPGLVRHEQPALVADRLGRDMLIGLRLLHHRRGMDTGLGRESRSANIGRVPVGRAIEQFVERVADLGQRRELFRRHADFKAIREVALQQKRRDQRYEIGVAAPFAKAVQRALNMPRSSEHGGERIGDRIAGVVMRVNAKMRSRDMLRYLRDDARDLMRERSAIGIAKHDPSGARRMGGLGDLQRVVFVGLEAVEEMLAIEDHLAARRPRRLDRLGYIFEIFLECAAERDMDMIIPGLAHEGDDIGLRREKAGDARIIGGGAARSFGHAEGREASALQLELLREKFRVERIGARITALDVIDPETVEQRRDMALVGERKIDVSHLRAIAQGRVQKAEFFAHHGEPFRLGLGGSAFVIRVLPSHRPSISTVLR